MSSRLNFVAPRLNGNQQDKMKHLRARTAARGGFGMLRQDRRLTQQRDLSGRTGGMFKSSVRMRGGDGERALASIGIISDIQYADVEDGASHGGTPRYYRHALEAVKDAVASWLTNPDVYEAP